MSQDHASAFRPGDVLCTAFTGTLIEREGALVELLESPEDLASWLRTREFEVRACTPAQLERARELREAIHRAAVAAADQQDLSPAAVEIINARSREGGAHAVLRVDASARWLLREAAAVTDALGVIAADAVAVLSGERGGRLARCASDSCRAVFLDSSRGHSRRWCDMNTCGNREKKARFRAQHRETTPGSDAGRRVP